VEQNTPSKPSPSPPPVFMGVLGGEKSKRDEKTPSRGESELGGGHKRPQEKVDERLPLASATKRGERNRGRLNDVNEKVERKTSLQQRSLQDPGSL